MDALIISVTPDGEIRKCLGGFEQPVVFISDKGERGTYNLYSLRKKDVATRLADYEQMASTQRLRASIVSGRVHATTTR